MMAGSFPGHDDVAASSFSAEQGHRVPEFFNKAKACALRLFKIRPRSQGELEDKLKAKGFSSEVIAAVVQACGEYGLVDDRSFCKAWVQGRSKRYGLKRIVLELGRKRVAKEIIADVCAEVGGEVDEEAVVRGIARRRWELNKKVLPLKRKKRVMDYLARRGFDATTINRVLRQL